MRDTRSKGFKRLLQRAVGVVAAAAMALGIGVVAAAPASAGGTACASGYICFFDLHGNTNDRERYFSGSNTNYTTWQWGSYAGGWHLIPSTTINNQVSAMNRQINKPLRFFDDTAMQVPLLYYPTGNLGYSNLTGTTWNNKASGHRYY